MERTRYAKRYTDKEIDIALSLTIVKVIANIEDLKPCKVDIGKLAVEWLEGEHHFKNLNAFVF